MGDSVLAFAAQRERRMNDADADLRPLVERALAGWTADGVWYTDLIEAASVLWLEHFEAEAPNADPDRFIGRFQAMLAKSLAETADPGDPVGEHAVERVTKWLSTVSVNDATYRGNGAHGGKGMRWATMRDEDVREAHQRANGQIADADGTFDIDGHDLHYPGEPVGPPEVWINCRCILVPARVEGALAMADAIVAAVEAPEAPPVEEEAEDAVESEEDEMIEDEFEDGEDIITEIPVHGVATIEGRPTGDGRQFGLGALHFASLPQPLGFEFESGHGSDNSRVAIVGRIDRFETVDAGDGTNLARWSGVIMLDKPYAQQALEGVIDGSYQGVSVIIDAVEVDVSEQREEIIRQIEAERAQTSSEDENAEATEENEMTPEEIADMFVGDGTMPVTTFSSARIRRFDMVPTPAFVEAFLAIGDKFYDELSPEEQKALDDCGCSSGVKTPESGPQEDEDEENVERGYDEEEEGIAASASFAPGTKDGPGWITHPVPTARIRRYWVRGKGAAKIRWGVSGDFNRCRMQLAKYVQNPEWLAGLCANMHKEAIGVWPGQERAGAKAIVASGALFALVASGGSVKPSKYFENPMLNRPTPIKIDGDHIYGHLATWGVCHIGIQNECVVAPNSHTNYALFRTGVVNTEVGEIPVGNITMGTGHPDITWSMSKAVAHYDNTGTVVADVTCGEDAYGIWVSGMLRPGLSDETIDALAASALSGDWRPTSMGDELVAALSVNVPGFPVPRVALAASGAISGVNIVLPDPVAEAVVAEFDMDEMVSMAVKKYREAEVERARRMNALEPFYNKVRARRMGALTAKFGQEN